MLAQAFDDRDGEILGHEPSTSVSFLWDAYGAAEAALFQNGTLNQLRGKGSNSAHPQTASLRSHCAAFHASLIPLQRLTRPSHARRIMCDAELPFRVEHDDAAVSIQSLFQIIHRFLRRPLGKISRNHAVGGPF